jgi:excinuclease ABC subunit C
MQKIKAKKHLLRKNEIAKTPEKNGVYIFWNKTPLYIGKAVNLKSRLRSYLNTNLNRKTALMIKEANMFSYIPVLSELEALLLESKLIKTYLPKYNIELKDDKHPLYILITKDEYPKVVTARKQDINTKDLYFGPFPASTSVRSVLKMVRRIFPFSQHKLGKRACLYNQIGLCYPCPNEINSTKNTQLKKHLKRQYLRNISHIKAILEGKLPKVRKSLEKEMKLASEKEDFENALIIKEKIDRLDYITQPITPVSRFIKNPNLVEDIRNIELTSLYNTLKKELTIKNLRRIECFDVAHLSGSQPTASMVTFINGDPDKSFYRHFRIRQKKGQDDISSMKEIAERREKYLSTWGIPNLIIVDGGKAQVRVFEEVFSKHDIPVAGLAKRLETLVIPKNTGTLKYIEIRVPKSPALNLLQRLRNEAHRFARRYHHKLLIKALIPDK